MYSNVDFNEKKLTAKLPDNYQIEYARYASYAVHKSERKREEIVKTIIVIPFS